jgi:hypothetical protein
MEALYEIDSRDWYDSKNRSKSSTWSSDQIMLVERERPKDSGQWAFKSMAFDLRQGRSIELTPLYACFEYDSVYDLVMTYELSAENLPGVAGGTIQISVMSEK